MPSSQGPSRIDKRVFAIDEVYTEKTCSEKPMKLSENEASAIAWLPRFL